MFPDHLFENDIHNRIYTFTLRQCRRCPRMTLFRGKPISLRPRETLVPTDPLDSRLRLTLDEFKSSISELEAIDFVRATWGAGYCLLYYANSWLPPDDSAISPENLDENSGAQMTVSEFFDFEIQYVGQTYEKKTLENTTRVAKHFKALFGRNKVGTLKHHHMHDYIDWRRRKYLEERGTEITDITLNVDIRTVKAAFNRAVDRGNLKENPFAKVKQIKCDDSKTRGFKEEEYRALMEVITDEAFKQLIRFYVATGMRRGEAIDLKWENVDMLDRTITITPSQNYHVKHGKTRYLYISDDALHILKHQERIDPYVFNTTEGKPFRFDSVTKAFKAAVRAAELDEELHLHSLRSSCASFMKAAGADLDGIQAVLGHTYSKTTEGYINIPAEKVRRALNSFSVFRIEGTDPYGSIGGESQQDDLDYPRESKPRKHVLCSASQPPNEPPGCFGTV
jgi:integrase